MGAPVRKGSCPLCPPLDLRLCSDTTHEMIIVFNDKKLHGCYKSKEYSRATPDQKNMTMR